jgi:hypothetical protein
MKRPYSHSRQFKIQIYIYSLTWLLCLSEANGQGTLVQNGDFSSPDGSSIPGWNVSGGLMWSAYNGVNGGSFAGIGGYFSQTLATQPGETYLLQFYTTTGVPGISQSGPYGLSVTWDSEAPVSYTSTQESYNWVADSLQVTAHSSQTLLTFTSIYGAIPYLDDVNVVSIPEPGTGHLFFTTLTLLIVWKMFRHQRPNTY